MILDNYLGYACHYLEDALCPPHCTEWGRYTKAEDSHREFEEKYATIPDKFLSCLRVAEEMPLSSPTDIKGWIIRRAEEVRKMGPPEKNLYSNLLTEYNDDEMCEILTNIGSGIRGLYNFVASSAPAELTSTIPAKWTRTFGGGKCDEARSVQQTRDGGYIIAGRTKSYGAGGSDAWLIKTDAEGSTIR